MFIKILVKIKKMFDFNNFSAKSKYYDDSNKSAVGRMKDGTDSDATEEFIGLKPKMYSFLVDDSGGHKKAKSVNKNVVATISHNEYTDVFLDQKCLRHSMNTIQSKNHRIGTYEIHKMSLLNFEDKIQILSNGYDGLALGY